MKLGLLQLAAAGFVALLVLAFVFRSRRANEALRFISRVAWVYIAVIVALAAWELAREGI